MKRFLLLPLLLWLALLAGPVHAASDMFLKIDGIDGESTDERHEGWIEVLSFSWGVSSTATPGSGAGKPIFSDLSWVQLVDTSTVPLFLGVSGGRYFDTATFDVVRQGEIDAPFFQMIFHSALLTSLQISGAAGGGTPFASASLASNRITMNYWPQQSDGSLGPVISGTWNLATGSANGFVGDINVLQGLFLSGGSTSNLGDLPMPAPVPEPQQWALLLLGLLFIGRRAAAEAGPRHA